jgi:benzoyl-CoA-dihydrodiol lyase
MALDTAAKVIAPGDTPPVSFATDPTKYRHWRLSIAGRVATLAMDVDENGGLRGGYAMKLNSYDLGVDIELHDAVQRLRFEHPEVAAVIITSAKDRCFSAGANIGMLAQSSHPWKVNFCKFTNETRFEIDILVVDDGSTAVSLPELPLLAVLPATGGLTRVVDKRHVRRDLADVFVTKSEGIKAPTAVQWGLVDAAIPKGQFDAAVHERATHIAERATGRPVGRGVPLDPLVSTISEDAIDYEHVSASLDRGAGVVTISISGPSDAPPADPDGARALGSRYWPLACGRQLDDLILHLRVNELALGTWVIKTVGEIDAVLAHDRFLRDHRADWFINEVALLLKRVFKRLDVTSRSLIASIEPGSCFVGLLLELALACDQQFMLDGTMEEGDRPATIAITDSNTGVFPMGNGLSRLESRFFGRMAELASALARTDVALDAAAASAAGLVTFVPDAIDWDDEVRIALEERSSFSPDALTAMEANIRFVGPETLETKIFGRLTAWQNWVFSRPNAIGPTGALRRYGSGQRATLDKDRV